MAETPDTILVIRHVEGSSPPQFEVHRLQEPKRAGPFTPPPAAGFPVESRPDSDLLHELRWYLEDFLTYPFPPETDHADRVLAALRDWGEQSFRALFDNRDSLRMFDAAVADGYENLRLQISSDDPRILAWPWEALRIDERGVELAHTCRIERKLNALPDPRPVPAGLPQDRISILLVVCRPYGEKDVRFRSVARPVVDLIESENLPAEVEVLRPPTFEQLRTHLRKHKGRYHIVHFDGHGSYAGASAPNGFQLGAKEGLLVFENDEGEPDEVSASRLNRLLVDSDVPTVVLNACQSAMQSQDAGDPFASVAAALLRAGTRSVVAMSYSLYVSGAQEFLPAFYSRLFDSGRLARAVMAGRQRMLAQPKRISARGPFELHDWLLPVICQQGEVDLPFSSRADRSLLESKLNDELRDRVRRMQFIGRDGPLLELERAMRLRPAGILIHGLGGVGKTTLAAGFLDWLDKTGGLEFPPFWFDFREIRSAEFVVNSIGTALFGGNFPAMGSLEQRVDGLAQALSQNRLVIVFDNFESAAGLESVGVRPNLPEEDRDSLRRLLDGLYGGKTKVLITSRSDEAWLPAPRCRGKRVELPGLDGEERWEFCDEILRDLGLTVNRDDPELDALMKLLRGHPLAMRALLPKLESTRAAQLIDALKSNLSKLDGDEQWNQVQATIGLVVDALPTELQPLLELIGFHESYVDADYLEAMAKQLEPSRSRTQVDHALASLSTLGFVRDIGQSIYEMHPALTGFLRGRGAAEYCARAFVDVMGSLADQYAPKELHEQRGVFHLHGANFRFALSEAQLLGMELDVRALTQALAAHAQNARDYSEADRLFEQLAAYNQTVGYAEGEAAAYHQRGLVAEERRDFEAAEKWYLKSLAIKEKQGNEHGAATSYHQLGIVAQQRRDFEAAGRWYLRALEIFARTDSQHNAQIVVRNFLRAHQQAPPKEQTQLREMWEETGLPWPEDADAAGSSS